jgi:hypothetical protein
MSKQNYNSLILWALPQKAKIQFENLKIQFEYLNILRF